VGGATEKVHRSCSKGFFEVGELRLGGGGSGTGTGGIRMALVKNGALPVPGTETKNLYKERDPHEQVLEGERESQRLDSLMELELGH